MLIVNYKYTNSGRLTGEYTTMLTVIKINTRKIKNILKSTAQMVFPHFYTVRKRQDYFFLLFVSKNNSLLLFKKPYDDKWNESINNSEDFIHIDILGGEDWSIVDVVNDVNPYIAEGAYNFAVLRQDRASKKIGAIFYQYKYPKVGKGSFFEQNRVEFSLEDKEAIPCKLLWDSKNELALLIAFAPLKNSVSKREYKLCLYQLTISQVVRDNTTGQTPRQIFETPSAFSNSPDTPFSLQYSFWNEGIGSLLMLLSRGRLFSFRFYFPSIDSKEIVREDIKEPESMEMGSTENLMLSQVGELISRKSETNQVSVVKNDGNVFLAVVRSEEDKDRVINP